MQNATLPKSQNLFCHIFSYHGHRHNADLILSQVNSKYRQLVLESAACLNQIIRVVKSVEIEDCTRIEMACL